MLRGFVLMFLINFFFLFKHNRPDTKTQLDDFQVLKSEFATWTPMAHPSYPDSRAVVSALYNDMYTIPAATLGHSLQTVGTNARRILFHTGHLSARALCIVRVAGWELLEVELIPPPHDGAGIGHRFGDQYTKLHLWSLDNLLGIDRVVYVDSDALARQNFDELFDLPFPFAAVPDVFDTGFKLAFNAGVLVLHPNQTTYESMLARIHDARFPPDQAEQAFLNLYFGADAVRLPYVYNANLAIHERSSVLWDAMRDQVRIVHYTSPKPFPLDGKEIVDGVRLERSINQAKRKDGGMFTEAIGWWQDAYNDFRTKNMFALQQCDRLS